MRMNLVPFSTRKVQSPWNDMQTTQQERKIQLPLSLRGTGSLLNHIKQ